MNKRRKLSPETRIAVTGGAGFLGTRVVRKLREVGCEQVFVPRSSDYDLRETDAVERMYTDTQPEVVIHLAAVVGGIGAKSSYPGSFFYDNAMMGVQPIEYARRFGVRKFLCVGTVRSYPKHAPIPFKESVLWDGYPEEINAPYAFAKKILLVQLQAYREQYGFNGIYLLPVNLYVLEDNFDLETAHVIPAIIRKFVEAKREGLNEVIAWGTGEASCEFLYVHDAADGIVSAAELYDSPDPVNLGAADTLKPRMMMLGADEDNYFAISIGVGFGASPSMDLGDEAFMSHLG